LIFKKKQNNDEQEKESIEIRKIKQIVKDCYLENLLREPDDIGLNHYSKELENKNIKKSDLIKILRNSEEFQVIKMKKFEGIDCNFNSLKSKEEIEHIFHNTAWYHWISINNLETQNTRTSKAYQKWISQNLPGDLTDKTVLDIGCADGFYSFLCESRNAKKVVAIDLEYFDIKKTDPTRKDNPNNFQILKEVLDSKVEYKKLDIYDVEKLDEKFDYVLMYGVYYHLKDLVLALNKVSNIVTDSVFLSGHILDTDEPMMYYYPNVNFSPIVASSNCLINIAKNFCQFKTAECIDTITMDLGKIYPHNPNSTIDKIGLFKFSK